MKRLFFAMVFALGASLFPLSGLIHAEYQASDSKSSLTDKDKKILEDSHESNMKEIAYGSLAQTKGTSANVQSYAKMLVDDHSYAEERVKTLAAKYNVQLKDVKTSSSKLDNKTGAAFDNELTKIMIDDHKKDVKKIEEAKKDIKSDDVRNLVDEVLPKLQMHLDHAQSMQSPLKNKDYF